MKTFLILLLAVAVASATTTRRKRATYEASLDTYVDSAISNLQSFLVASGYNSLSLPNVTESFSVKPVWITYSGSLSLYEGILGNLASLKRYGDVKLVYSDKTLTLSANLGIDSVSIDYTYQTKLLAITASGTVEGAATEIDTSTSLSANLEAYTLALDSFTVNSVGTISAQLQGNVITDWLASTILNLVLLIIKNDVTTQLETAATSVMESGLEEINNAIATLVAS